MTDDQFDQVVEALARNLCPMPKCRRPIVIDQTGALYEVGAGIPPLMPNPRGTLSALREGPPRLLWVCTCGNTALVEFAFFHQEAPSIWARWAQDPERDRRHSERERA